MMVKRFILSVFMALALAAGAASARADEPTPSPLLKALPSPPDAVSVQAWGEGNPDCAEWSNTCVVCKRGEAGVSNCSTPGIACQPMAIACVRKAKTPAK